jgi:hypothetical protein
LFSRYIIRSLTKPNYVWSASRGNISLKLFDVKNEYQEWLINNNNKSLKNVKENKAVEYEGIDEAVTLKSQSTSSIKQKFTFEIESDTHIKSDDRTTNFLVIKDDHGDELVYAGTDGEDKWKIVKKESQ